MNEFLKVDALRESLDHVIAQGVWVDPLSALLGAFVFGQVIAWTYEKTYRGLSYSRGFSHTLVLVTISASILVLSMKHSVLAGLGLFGVLSMIRFRTDLKTPRDLVFVMGCACLGVATGAGAILEAFLGTTVFGAVALYLYTSPFGSRTRFDGVLRFRLPIGLDVEPGLSRLLRRHCRQKHLLSTADVTPSADEEALEERVYQVKFFRDQDREELVAALRSEFGSRETRLMLQDATSEY
jgi:hypothetical protein